MFLVVTLSINCNINFLEGLKRKFVGTNMDLIKQHKQKAII